MTNRWQSIIASTVAIIVASFAMLSGMASAKAVPSTIPIKQTSRNQYLISTVNHHTYKLVKLSDTHYELRTSQGILDVVQRPVIRNGKRQFHITVTAKGKTGKRSFLNIFANHPVNLSPTGINQGTLTRSTATTNAVLIAVMTGSTWALGYTGAKVLDAMQQEGLVQVAVQLIGEGESVWQVAGLILGVVSEIVSGVGIAIVV